MSSRTPIRGLSRSQLAWTLRVSYRTASRYLKELGTGSYQHGVDVPTLERLAVDQELIDEARERARATAGQLLAEVATCRECMRLKRVCNDHAGPIEFAQGIQLSLF